MPNFGPHPNQFSQYDAAEGDIIKATGGDSPIYTPDTSSGIITDWVSWTPTSTWTGGIAALVGQQRWVGDTIELQIMLVTSGAVTPINTDLYFTIPAGVSIDLPKTVYGASAFSAISGEVWYRDNGVSDYRGTGCRMNTTNGWIYPYTASNGLFRHNVPFTFASGDHVWVVCSFPAVQA